MTVKNNGVGECGSKRASFRTPPTSAMEPHPDFAISRTHRIERLACAQNIMEWAEERRDHDDHGGHRLRRLSIREVDALEQNGCSSGDWTKLRVMMTKTATTTTSGSGDGGQEEEEEYFLLLLRARLVTTARFDGRVVFLLSSCSSSPSRSNETVESGPVEDGLPLGLHGCLLVKNSIISVNSCRIHRCACIADTFVDHGATIINCGTIQSGRVAASSPSCPSFLNISIGAESGGGRVLTVTPEATLLDLSTQLKNPGPRGVQLLTEQSHTSATVAASAITSCRFNIIGQHCNVRDTNRIESVFLHNNVTIHGASSVRNTVLLPHSTIDHGSIVHDSFLQWHAKVSGHSTVSNCLVMEHTSVGPLSTVAASILSPDVHVSAGEVHASWIGPNTSAHHQSLLIGVIWPAGRGNVGYGANVGSNHTGRLPDQECAAGEGVFWGLSCVIKLPVDLSMAPYSIVAAGVQLGPMRCTMPFSLLVTADNGATTILPGWVWKHSPYTIVRSEAKFATRRQAQRHFSATGWKILRPHIVELCRQSRESLAALSASSRNAMHVIGHCTLTEKARLSGIQAYSSLIQLFALRGLLADLQRNERLLVAAKDDHQDYLSKEILRVDDGMETYAVDPVIVQWPAFPWETDQSDAAVGTWWSYQKSLLWQEFPKDKGTTWEEWTRAALHRLVQLESAHVESIYECKRRDDERGSSIVPGYTGSHVAANDDPVIASARAVLRHTSDEVARLVAILSLSKTSKL